MYTAIFKFEHKQKIDMNQFWEPKFKLIHRLKNKTVEEINNRLDKASHSKSARVAKKLYKELRDLQYELDTLTDKAQIKVLNAKIKELKIERNQCLKDAFTYAKLHTMPRISLNTYGTNHEALSCLKNQKLVTKYTYDTIAQDVWDGFIKQMKNRFEGKSQDVRCRYQKYKDFNLLPLRRGRELNNDKLQLLRQGVLHITKYKFTLCLNKREQHKMDHLLDTGKIKTINIAREKRADGKYNYFLQLTVDGPLYDPKNHLILSNKGSVGIDLGVSSIGVVTDNVAFYYDLDFINRTKYNEQIIENQRQIDVLRRKLNPDCYKEDGKAIKGKRPHVVNNELLRLQNENRVLYRKQTQTRKKAHLTLINSLLTLGDTFYVESNQIKEWQMRLKECNEKGKKKQYGGYINQFAPGLFIALLEQKVTNAGGTFIKIDSIQEKLAQYTHDTNSYEKKPLSQRLLTINDKKVSRRLYVAYLLTCINENNTLDTQQVIEKFNAFMMNHDQEVTRLHVLGKNPWVFGDVDELMKQI